jgi:pimeloyl-ACP methyl ester carboxylesterase
MAAVVKGYIDTNLGKIELRRGGAGPSLVYFHSASGEGDGLELLDRLAERFDVVAPMFPGFGESEGLDQIDDMEDATFHHLDLFDRLGLDRPIVAGVSLGGWMAAELATRYPERLGRLILVNPAGLYIEGAEIKDIFGRRLDAMVADLFFDEENPAARQMRDAGTFLRSRTEVPFELIRPYVQTMAATARLAWDPYLHNPKLRRRLHRITVPTLVVRATDDTLIPAEHARTYAADIDGAVLVEIDRAAHLVMIERPDALAEAIGNFAV